MSANQSRGKWRTQRSCNNCATRLHFVVSISLSIFVNSSSFEFIEGMVIRATKELKQFTFELSPLSLSCKPISAGSSAVCAMTAILERKPETHNIAVVHTGKHPRENKASSVGIFSRKIRCRTCLPTGRRQLHAPSVMLALSCLYSDQIDRNRTHVVGITTEDLYQDDDDCFVSGLANRDFHVAVISLCRADPHLQYSERHWYEVPVRTTERLTRRRRVITIKCRATKSIIHELGHLLGLPHCEGGSPCVMAATCSLSQEDDQPYCLCEKCRTALSS